MSISKDRILFEDDHLLAVNKRSGELVVRGKGTVQKLPLLDFLKQSYPGLRAVHRLDYETSGVVLFAKTKEAYEALKGAKWTKRYNAIILGDIRRTTGTIDDPLPARTKGEVESVTKYRVMRHFGSCTFVEATIETGRHHQIRRHFASIRHPLLFDEVYGNKKMNRAFTKEFRYRKFFLHAASVDLVHPVSGEKQRIKAGLPDAFEAFLRALKGD